MACCAWHSSFIKATAPSTGSWPPKIQRDLGPDQVADRPGRLRPLLDDCRHDAHRRLSRRRAPQKGDDHRSVDLLEHDNGPDRFEPRILESGHAAKRGDRRQRIVLCPTRLCSSGSLPPEDTVAGYVGPPGSPLHRRHDERLRRRLHRPALGMAVRILCLWRGGDPHRTALPDSIEGTSGIGPAIPPIPSQLPNPNGKIPCDPCRSFSALPLRSYWSSASLPWSSSTTPTSSLHHPFLEEKFDPFRTRCWQLRHVLSPPGGPGRCADRRSRVRCPCTASGRRSIENPDRRHVSRCPRHPLHELGDHGGRCLYGNDPLRHLPRLLRIEYPLRIPVRGSIDPKYRSSRGGSHGHGRFSHGCHGPVAHGSHVRSGLHHVLYLCSLLARLRARRSRRAHLLCSPSTTKTASSKKRLDPNRPPTYSLQPLLL